MEKFSVKCSCGYEMSVDAENKEAAAAMLKEQMNEEGVRAHMADRQWHKEEEPIPSQEQVHGMIDSQLGIGGESEQVG